MLSQTVIQSRYGSRIGKMFGMLTLLRVSSKKGDGNRVYGTFLCACGTIVDRQLSRVINGRPTHCGCRTDHSTHRRHGMRGSPEYSSWQAMKARCLDPENKDYPRWGGRGITIHPFWAASFEAFYEHIGPRPLKTTLDRIDNTKGYEPGNVRWAPASVQQTNRSNSWIVEINGILYSSIHAAAGAHGVSETTIVRWCEGGFDKRRAHHLGGGQVSPRDNCRRWRKYSA